MSALLLVAGPPCAGKSTLAQATGRRVVDWDEMYAELAGRPVHVRVDDVAIGREVERAFRVEVDRLYAERAPVVVVRAAPLRWVRGMYRRLYGPRGRGKSLPVGRSGPGHPLAQFGTSSSTNSGQGTAF